ncbi:MAG: sulfatase [Alphaproteobacteria bacterium]
MIAPSQAFPAWRFALLLSAIASVGFVLFRPAAPERNPDVFVVLVDTLRPDHLGTYGYDRPTSPAIDRIAASGTVFERAYTVAPWTNPSVSTLLTGLYPRALFAPTPPEGGYRQAMPRKVRTLASRFRSAGYATAALVDHPAIASPPLGFLRDFERVVRLSPEADRVWKTKAASADAIAATVTDAVAGRRPEFVYLHLVQPHWPYEPVPPYKGMFGPGATSRERSEKDRQASIDDYDAEIRWADDCIAGVERALRASGRWQHTWLVVMSDHGEGFFEHGLSDHGNSYYEELLRVPLVIRAPGGKRVLPPRVSTPVSTIDLAPTLLAMAGLPAARELPGRSLLDASSIAGRKLLFAEDAVLLPPEQAAVIEGSTKWVRATTDALYDLDADPGEHLPIAGQEAERARLAEALRVHDRRNAERRGGTAATPAQLPDETVERLRALGYAL